MYAGERLDLKYQVKDYKYTVFLSRSNSGWRSYDGIQVCGYRLFKEIVDYIENSDQSNVSHTKHKISLVGYSLGGLIARYTIGLLEREGWLERLDCVDFLTLATPHAGKLQSKLNVVLHSYLS